MRQLKMHRARPFAGRAPNRLGLLVGVLLLGTALVGRPRSDEIALADVEGEIELGGTTTSPWDPNSIGTGMLYHVLPSGPVPLPLLGMEVDLEVTGVLVAGEITQRFSNPTDGALEVFYVFPLPEQAAVHHMEMRIGSRRIVAMVREREAAREVYESARIEGRKAGLVEQERPNLFTISAANIGPGEEVEVTLRYHDRVDYAAGVFDLDCPLTFTPRYAPAADPTAELPFVPGGDSAAVAATVRARITPGVPVARVGSGSHEVDVWRTGDTWEVAPLDDPIAADRDFRLSWELVPGRWPASTVFVEERGGEAYGFLMLVPPRQPPGEAGPGFATETLFVIDVSASMKGPSIVQAREALLTALDRLRPEDAYNIVAFDDEPRALAEHFIEAGDEVLLDEARSWVEDLEADGGTMILSALQEAIILSLEGGSERVRRIVFLTDGAVSNESRILAEIARGLGDTRLHTIGIGRAPNRDLMRKMASMGRGRSAFVSDQIGSENRIEAFFASIDRPVLTDVALEWQGVRVHDMEPARLCDLHAGDPLLVSFRLSGDVRDASVSLRGRVEGRWWAQSWDLGDHGARRGSGIAARWARAAVGSLLDSVHGGADPAEVEDAVIELGTEFQIVTPYTSLVAVESFTSVAGPGETVWVPSTLPGVGAGPPLPSGGTYGPLVTLVGLVLAGGGGGMLWGTRGARGAGRRGEREAR